VEVMSVGPSAHGLWLWIHSMALCPSCLTILSLSLSLSHYNPGQLVSDSGAPRQTFPTTFFHFIYPTLSCSSPYIRRTANTLHIHYAHVISNSQQHSALVTKLKGLVCVGVCVRHEIVQVCLILNICSTCTLPSYPPRAPERKPVPFFFGFSFFVSQKGSFVLVRG
jgi:hypothetical protein